MYNKYKYLFCNASYSNSSGSGEKSVKTFKWETGSCDSRHVHPINLPPVTVTAVYFRPPRDWLSLASAWLIHRRHTGQRRLIDLEQIWSWCFYRAILNFYLIRHVTVLWHYCNVVLAFDKLLTIAYVRTKLNFVQILFYVLFIFVNA